MLSSVRCEVGMIEAPKVVVPFEEAILVGFLKDCVGCCRYMYMAEIEAPEENEQLSDQSLDCEVEHTSTSRLQVFGGEGDS